MVFFKIKIIIMVFLLARYPVAEGGRIPWYTREEYRVHHVTGYQVYYRTANSKKPGFICRSRV